MSASGNFRTPSTSSSWSRQIALTPARPSLSTCLRPWRPGGRLSAWRERVRLVRVADMPGGPDPWARERHQRESIWSGLGDARLDDLVCFSDCDEIPSAGVLASWAPEAGVCLAEQQLAYYWLNCFGGGWGGTILGEVCRLRERSLSHWRNQSPDKRALPAGGWHFSFLGGVEAIRGKLGEYAHQDLNLPHYQDERWLRVATGAGIDLFRRGLEYNFGPLSLLPACVRQEPERYARLWRDAAFTERWISDQQLCWLVDTYRRVIDLPGDVVEIGAWEGRSTVALANMAYPDAVCAVDTWEGSADESPDHETVLKCRERDVAGRFLRNVAALTPGNVRVVRRPSQAALADWAAPVKFAHVDGAHDYGSVRRDLALLSPLVPPGGVICGDDYLSAEGVRRAVHELLPGFEHVGGNFWVWQRKA